MLVSVNPGVNFPRGCAHITTQPPLSETPHSAIQENRSPGSETFHDLRHTCATLLLSEGVNAKVVSELLGHASITITLNTYAHVLPDMQDSAADAMEAALS